jgi:hypothetical protein
MAASPVAAAQRARPDGDIAAAHAALRDDKTIQFSFPVDPPPSPEPPAWLEQLTKLIQAIAPAMEWVFWIALAAVVLTVLAFIAREVARSRWPGRFKPAVLTGPEPWRPGEAAARVLLADADALAAQGRYAEAAHLLLRRSVQDIQGSRPRLVRPALTSRDIAALPGLPQAARDAFGAIARIVERSLFGGRAVDEGGWRAARAAYADFALPGVLA